LLPTLRLYQGEERKTDQSRGLRDSLQVQVISSRRGRKENGNKYAIVQMKQAHAGGFRDETKLESCVHYGQGGFTERREL